jgi:hypothetical protein
VTPATFSYISLAKESYMDFPDLKSKKCNAEEENGYLFLLLFCFGGNGF